MSVTVSDLLKLPSLRQARVIGGAGGLKKVLELGVDLLQGFYLARPMAEPAPVNPAALSVIAAFHTIA